MVSDKPDDEERIVASAHIPRISAPVSDLRMDVGTMEHSGTWQGRGGHVGDWSGPVVR
jgi:hypothetical protein